MQEDAGVCRIMQYHTHCNNPSNFAQNVAVILQHSEQNNYEGGRQQVIQEKEAGPFLCF